MTGIAIRIPTDAILRKPLQTSSIRITTPLSSSADFNDENCAFPYFIENECEDVYLNVANINNLEEVDITVLPKHEYEERLKKVVGTVCVNCANYEEDNVGDNLEGHRDHINLDGKCNSYTPLKK